jgi:hypothetical protein
LHLQDLPASATLAFMEFVWMTLTGKRSLAVTCCLQLWGRRACLPLNSTLRIEETRFLQNAGKHLQRVKYQIMEESN